MWHYHEIEAAQMMNARLDYSLKICIMNASPYSPTKQRGEGESNAKLRKASQQNAREKYAGCNCQILSQGLKGTGQSLWVKSDMLFRICSQERIPAMRYRAVFINIKTFNVLSYIDVGNLKSTAKKTWNGCPQCLYFPPILIVFSSFQSK